MKRTPVFLGIVLAAIAAAMVAYRIRATREATPESSSPTDANQSNTPATTATTLRGGVTIDSRRQQLIGVRTVAARRTELMPTIRTVGTVRSAETRLTDINLKLDGWIRELFVDYTGQPITKGQPLFALYSPDLLATEHEYLLALKTQEQLRSSQVADARERAEQLVASARLRLTLWDLPDTALRTLDEQRRAHDTVTFRSPVNGVVMEKAAIQGMHVAAGQTLYTVADLSIVWIEADVYELEMPLVHVGERATVTLDAYPGEPFDGRVVYIYPYVDENTRTNKVRYEFSNPRGRLKPGMFANIAIAAPAGSAIVVPLNALLDSGQEQIVFVGQGDGYFEPRKVTAGRRVGDEVQILDGVKAGERVATGAAFFLDSESQLRAAVQGYEPTRRASASAAPSSQLDIAFRTTPDPPKLGQIQIEVAVKDASGKPLEGADVLVRLFMPAMPTMNMPAMQNEATLAPAGNGVYRGPGQMLMAGQWQATVIVTRGGQRLGTRQLAVVAR